MKNKTKKSAPVNMDELLNVLSFYADKENYDDLDGRVTSQMTYDKGLEARKILKKLVKEELNREGIKNNL